MEQKISKELSAGCEVPGDVLVHYHPGVPQHLGTRHRALQPAGLAGAVPGDHQHVLRCSLHAGDAAEDVRLGLPGDDINDLTDIVWHLTNFRATLSRCSIGLISSWCWAACWRWSSPSTRSCRPSASPSSDASDCCGPSKWRGRDWPADWPAVTWETAPAGPRYNCQ